jgi:outer membrane protein OmpA-like peptidoglycan-associated protein
MYISKREIRYRKSGRVLISEFILDHPPQIQNPRDRYLTDMENWTSISGLYTAKGGEQFISIGGFYPYHDTLVQVIRPERKLKKSYRDWEKHIGYYYVDDVSVIPCGMNWQTDIYYILRYVYFDFDQIALVSNSIDELNRLSAHLKKHPTYNISIKGHTDDFGTDEYNNVLSIGRAGAVVEWLADTGKIDLQRITYSGAGKSEPIAENDTEYGRSLNRRVEFVLTDTVTNTEIKSNL